MSPSPWPNGRRPHVLAIDHDASVLALLRDLLEDEGYQVSTQPTIDKDLGVGGALQPDLIILDAMWAGEDHGWSSLQMLRLDPGTTRIPIVLCTGAAPEVEALRPHLEEMQVRVVLKPFNIDHLVEVIAAALDSPSEAPAGD